MEQFSSCYFCGDAVDASLDEYPVVPASVDPGAATRRQIVLCASCKRKLDPVVEAVVDAAGDATVSLDRSNTDVREQETAGTDPGDGGPGDESDGDPATAADIGTTLGDDEDVLRPVGSDDTTDEETDDGEERPDGQGDGRRYTSGQRAGGRPTGDDEDGDGGDDRERETTLTRLENTSVMRLLQNREFPVDREEFVTVAASAYELSPSHCEKVVDLAVSHDLLDERDGELHAGEKWG